MPVHGRREFLGSCLATAVAGGFSTSQFVTAQDGLWSDKRTWVGEVVPDGVPVTINHRVVLDPGSRSAGKVTIGASGELVMDNGARLDVHDASVVIFGRLSMGYAWLHFDVTTDAGFRGGENPDNPDTDFGLYNRGTWVAVGSPMKPFSPTVPFGAFWTLQEDRFGNDISAMGVQGRKAIDNGAATLMYAPSGWNLDDNLLLMAPDGRAALSNVTAIDGNRVEFDNPAFRGDVVEYGLTRGDACIANLSRRCRISANGPGQRAHTMVMADSTWTQLENVEFRELGVPGKLGRYPIHFHKMGDASTKVAPIKGCVTWSRNEPGQRSLVIHETSHVTVEDNVAYNVMDHAVMMESTSLEFGNTVRNSLVSTLTDPPPHLKLPVARETDAPLANLRSTSVTSHHYWLNGGNAANPNTFEGLIAHGPGVSVNLLQTNPANSHSGPPRPFGTTVGTKSLGCSNGPWGWNHSEHIGAVTVHCENGTFGAGNPFTGRTDILFRDSTFLLNQDGANSYAHIGQRFERCTFVGDRLSHNLGTGLFQFNECKIDVNTLHRGSDTGIFNFSGSYRNCNLTVREHVMSSPKVVAGVYQGFHSPVLRIENSTGTIASSDGQTVNLAQSGGFALFIHRKPGDPLLRDAAPFGYNCQVILTDPGRAKNLIIMPRLTRGSTVNDWNEPLWYSMTPGDLSQPEAPLADWRGNTTLSDYATLDSSWALSPWWQSNGLDRHVNSTVFDFFGNGFIPDRYVLRVYDAQKSLIGFRELDLLSANGAAVYKEDLTTAPPPPLPDGVYVMDEVDSGFSILSGNWGVGMRGAFNNSNRWHAKGSGEAKARWLFGGLEPGQYDVFATWVKLSNRATNTPYTVASDGMVHPTVRVNQELDPDTLIDGVLWQRLGTYPVGVDGNMSILITNDANEYVIADAIRLESR